MMSSRHVMLVAVALAIAIMAFACSTSSPDPTPTRQPTATAEPSPTPSPLLTRGEAREVAQRFATSDTDAIREIAARYPETLMDTDTAILCTSNEDRYSAERQTWVIHCTFLDQFGFAAGATAVAGQLTAIGEGVQVAITPLPPEVRDRMRTFLEKTYLVDDMTGQVRD